MLQICGFYFGVLALSTLFFTIINLYKRKSAIIITENFIRDNSKYDSIGTIYWHDIIDIRRINNNGIEIFVNKTVLRKTNLNYIKKFLLFMNNWNYNKSVIITTAFLDCNTEETFANIYSAYLNNKNYTQHRFCKTKGKVQN